MYFPNKMLNYCGSKIRDQKLARSRDNKHETRVWHNNLAVMSLWPIDCKKENPRSNIKVISFLREINTKMPQNHMIVVILMMRCKLKI